MSEKVFRFADGTAEIQFDNGDRYRGEYRNDTMTGHGIYYRADGKLMEGQFENGLLNGHGVILFFNRDDHSFLEGEFLRDKLNGPVTITRILEDETATTEAVYVNDHREGPCRVTYLGPDGSVKLVVEGNYHNEKFNGPLKKSWSDGSSIEGTAKDGDFTGKVVYHLGSGHGDQEGWVYEGEVTENANSTYLREDVSARTITQDGTVYEGPYEGNVMNGRFRITHPDGSVEEAEFVKGIRVVDAEIMTPEPMRQEVVTPEILPPEAEKERNVQQPAGASFCVSCGNKLFPGAKFCVKCGAKLT